MERLTTMQQCDIEQALFESGSDAWKFAAKCYDLRMDQLAEFYIAKCHRMQVMYQLAINRELPGY